MAALLVVGTGRAGGALAIASQRAGHRIVGTLNRNDDDRFGPVLGWDRPLPPADLLVIAVRDAAIAEVADRLRGNCGGVDRVVHVSGATSVDALRALSDECATGVIHPLQTLPDAETGADSLAGAGAAITAAEPLAAYLEHYASSLGMRPFPLDDAVRGEYHAAASAAANFVVAALGVAADLFAAAGVPLDAARPLTDQVVANVFGLGPSAALTGPVARGDVDTVRVLQAAADRRGVGSEYALMVRALAIRAGRDPETLA